MDTLTEKPSTNTQKRSASGVWIFFQKIPPNAAQCQLCGNEFKHNKSSTSNLKKHIMRKHKGTCRLYIKAELESGSATLPAMMTTREQQQQQGVAPPEPGKTFGKTNTNNKSTREARRTDAALQYFDFKKASPQTADCKLCQREISANVENMIKHIKNFHKESYPSLQKELLLSDRTTEVSGGAKTCSRWSLTSPSSMRVVKAKPKGKKSSFVWNYCEKLSPAFAKCNVCKSNLKLNNSGSTCALLQHLARHHHITRFTHAKKVVDSQAKRGEENEEGTIVDGTVDEEMDNEDIFNEIGSNGVKVKDKNEEKDPTATNSLPVTTALQSNAPSSTSSSQNLQSYEDRNKQQHNSIHDSLMRLLTINLLPPSFVELPEFKAFVKALNFSYELPTKKNILTSLIPGLTDKVKQKIKLDINDSCHVSLSAEKWIHQKTQTCITLMAHFINDSSWEMSNVVLETFDATNKEESLVLGEELKRVTEEWGITSKVATLVTDPSEITISVATLSAGWEPLGCFGQKLNTLILNSLNSVPEVSEIRRKTREIINYFEKNFTAYAILRSVQEQHNLSQDRLKSEEENRWNSILTMMERLLEQYEAVNTVLCYFNETSLCVSDDEIKMTRTFVDILRPFEDAIMDLSSDRYTSMSKVIPLSNVLLEVTAAAVEAEDSNSTTSENTTEVLATTLKNALLKGMKNHFRDLESNSTLAITTLLDPRFKDYAFTDTAAMESAKEQLLKEIVAIANASSNSSSSTSNQEGTNEQTIPTPDTAEKKTTKKASSIWNSFDIKVSSAGAKRTLSSQAENENSRYFQEAVIPREADPLEWWKVNQVQFPNHKVLAHKYLCIPATSVRWERLFSKEKEKYKKGRKGIQSDNLNSMLFLSGNLWHNNVD